jgi:hypothetical protein
MRALLVAMIPMTLLSAADFPIDHVTVAGADLHKLQASLQAVGLATVYGGPHHDQTTEMAMVSFPDGSYLELIAPQPHADAHLVAQHVWSKFLRGGDGPCAWALRAPHLASDVQRLKSTGIAVSGPAANGRERPDGVRLDWETANIGTAARGTFFPFLIHDVTARDLRAFPQGRAGNRDFRGVTRIVITVRSLQQSIAQYQQAFGLPAAMEQTDVQFGAKLATWRDSPVVLAQPLTAQSWLAARLDLVGEAPCAFVLGAIQPDRYRADSHSRWFDIDLSWFDSVRLGWRLGFEKSHG